MATKKKLLQAAAGSAGGDALNIEDVFSTYLYEGNGSTQTITNGIDLSGEGGLVWAKIRDTASTNHMLVDTERGTGSVLRTNFSSAEQTGTFLNSFNSDGFTLANNFDMNGSGYDIASWTFRKAPKFFDVVTWTGDGVSGRAIPHSLDSEVGFMVVKITSQSDNWEAYHRGVTFNAGNVLWLNSTNAVTTGASRFPSAPDSQNFYVGSDSGVNGSGNTYVAYLFAHNDGDGEFGPDGDADIIKCGSFTADASGSALVGPDLGWEPQWVLLKNATSTASGNWWIFDSMRGFTASGGGTAYLLADSSAQEYAFSGSTINLTSNGFTMPSDAFAPGQTFIYMAIRRGPLAVPESGTEVFAIDNQTASSAPFLTSNFPVDMVIRKRTSGSNSEVMSRLLQGKGLFANATSSEQTDSVAQFDFNDGCLDNTGADATRYGWMWRRAPGYFDAVAYSGLGGAGSHNHSLGVIPEMIWFKNRDDSQEWIVYHKDLTAGKHLRLNTDHNELTGELTTSFALSDTQFTFANDFITTNASGNNYIAYLFATLDGVSKVGSYTGDGTSNATNVIDCGFSGGARLVLIKRYDASGEWYLFDTDRGLVSGNDALLELNTQSAEGTSNDFIDPHSSGFAVNGHLNQNSATYIFYAIA